MLRALRLALCCACLAASPALAGPPDTDADGVADSLDNCLERSNPSQLDSDADGYGNACDADYDNDGVVTDEDEARLRASFGLTPRDAEFLAAADHDGNGRVDGRDFLAFGRLQGSLPGPSGLPCAGTSPCNQ